MAFSGRISVGRSMLLGCSMTAPFDSMDETNFHVYTNIRKPKVVIVGCSYVSPTRSSQTLNGTERHGKQPHSCTMRISPQCWCSISPYLTCEDVYDVEALPRIFELNRPDINFIQGTVTDVNSASQTMIYKDTIQIT